jgi:hypothetical protein
MGSLRPAPGPTWPGPRTRRPGRADFGGAGLLTVTVGWSAWFGNRRVGLRDRWFGSGPPGTIAAARSPEQTGRTSRD